MAAHSKSADLRLAPVTALLRLRVGVFFFFAFDRYAEGAQEVHIIPGEGASGGLGGSIRFLGLFGDFIEPDGGFEHEEHVKAMLADILNHACDLLAFDNRFVYCLSELLD
jgi:hypothetical protein